jgi:multiple sugar transport system permease protein
MWTRSDLGPAPRGGSSLAGSGSWARAALHHALAAGAAAVFVVPLLWVASASLRKPGLPRPRMIEWLPDPVAWSNYARVFEVVPLAGYIGNSLLVVAVAVPLTVVTASWAGLATAQLPPRTRRRLVLLAVMLLMVPAVALWLPRFVLFSHLGLIDTLGVLVAPAAMGASPLFVLLFYWTFRRVPAQLFEAARLDGANLLQLWARIAMPLARPTSTAVAVLAFALFWSDFVSPLLYLKSESRYTFPVGLQVLQQMDATNWPLLMAGAAIMTVPVLVLFLMVQRYFWPEGHRA